MIKIREIIKRGVVTTIVDSTGIKVITPENKVQNNYIELLQDYRQFLIANGRFSNVSYEVNTSQSNSSHRRYILHASCTVYYNS